VALPCRICPMSRPVDSRTVPSYSGTEHLVSCLGFGAECLDLLGLLVIEVSELISCFAIRPQQLVQLGVYGLSVAVFGSLNKECHQERGDDRNAVPTEVSGVKNQPKHGVKKHHPDDPRTRQPCSSICEKLLELLPHIQENRTRRSRFPAGHDATKNAASFKTFDFCLGTKSTVVPHAPANFRDQARWQPTDRAACMPLAGSVPMRSISVIRSCRQTCPFPAVQKQLLS